MFKWSFHSTLTHSSLVLWHTQSCYRVPKKSWFILSFSELLPLLSVLQTHQGNSKNIYWNSFGFPTTAKSIGGQEWCQNLNHSPFSLTCICDVRKDSENTTDPKHPLPVSRSGMSNTIMDACSNPAVGGKGRESKTLNISIETAKSVFFKHPKPLFLYCS